MGLLKMCSVGVLSGTCLHIRACISKVPETAKRIFLGLGALMSALLFQDTVVVSYS